MYFKTMAVSNHHGSTDQCHPVVKMFDINVCLSQKRKSGMKVNGIDIPKILNNPILGSLDIHTSSYL